ncbi:MULTISPECIES: hypothetical protein [unclassified Fusibacter]|uniref:hypothetical protein n=1 Tax=unclassified Fusibacter TaxID=2624464 RepID=UPI001013539A|nr:MULTISPECIES: hypothetical protein [unclassified Fusibacter]MCK8061507.1 hypothetical protein [Fusibacter sp. A2]NPE23692.1 hypothetical protein [Fusibacter sp. A1]RXV58869.1 hypothetical protein DWB64_18065 [Fusibacter sp. A1]
MIKAMMAYPKELLKCFRLDGKLRPIELAAYLLINLVVMTAVGAFVTGLIQGASGVESTPGSTLSNMIFMFLFFATSFGPTVKTLKK